MEPRIGIDFGTTNSVMTWCDDKGQAHLLRNAEGEEKTPSAVYFGASEVVVGTPAIKLVENPEESSRIVLSCKRFLKSNPMKALPEKRINMVDAAAAILGKLKQDAQDYHFHEPVRRAVITYPAAFGELERERIEQAARQAGFSDITLLEEPVAAAVAYARQGVQVGQHILVYDLGGGTFDLAVLLREGEDSFRLALEPRGLAACGGDDFDRALYDYLDERRRTASGLPIQAFSLNWLLRCRECKESLSHLSASQFSVYVEGKLFKERVERLTFEQLIHDRLEETIRLTQELMAEAAKRGQPVDTVVLIGGSARVPRITARLSEVLPIQPYKWQQQDVAVALGAALWAGQKLAAPKKMETVLSAAGASHAALSSHILKKDREPYSSVVIRVSPDGSGDYRTLEQAVEAVPEGGTIRLAAGEHQLSSGLLIYKSLRLIGSGIESTMIMCDQYSHVIKINGAKWFETEGITFQHTGELYADVMIVTEGELEVSRCRFMGGKYGSERILGDGLSLHGTCSGYIYQCQMDDNRQGISIDTQGQITLKDNYCKNNAIGINISGKAKPALDSNTCTMGAFGIYYTDKAGGLAHNNRCLNNHAAGILVSEQAQPALEDNICEETFKGIAYLGYAGGVARGNRCKRNKSGIFVIDQARPTLEENVCEGNEQCGIYYEENSGGIARKNQCYSNGIYGICVIDKAQPILEMNNCSQNGIFISSSAKPTLNNNNGSIKRG